MFNRFYLRLKYICIFSKAAHLSSLQSAAYPASGGSESTAVWSTDGRAHVLHVQVLVPSRGGAPRPNNTDPSILLPIPGFDRCTKRLSSSKIYV